jgi:hypothetical protein
MTSKKNPLNLTSRERLFFNLGVKYAALCDSNIAQMDLTRQEELEYFMLMRLDGLLNESMTLKEAKLRYEARVALMTCLISDVFSRDTEAALGCSESEARCLLIGS